MLVLAISGQGSSGAKFLNGQKNTFAHLPAVSTRPTQMKGSIVKVAHAGLFKLMVDLTNVGELTHCLVRGQMVPEHIVSKLVLTVHHIEIGQLKCW